MWILKFLMKFKMVRTRLAIVIAFFIICMSLAFVGGYFIFKKIGTAAPTEVTKGTLTKQAESALQ